MPPASESRPGAASGGLGWAVVGVVAVGGALGSAARYGLSTAWPTPWTTLLINIVGCLAIGALLAGIGARPLLRSFLGTGVLGGFTTFSAFAVETRALAERPWLAAGYLIATVAGALAAARAGEWLVRR